MTTPTFLKSTRTLSFRRDGYTGRAENLEDGRLDKVEHGHVLNDRPGTDRSDVMLYAAWAVFTLDERVMVKGDALQYRDTQILPKDVVDAPAPDRQLALQILQRFESIGGAHELNLEQVLHIGSAARIAYDASQIEDAR
jgi:hypothetical protein